MESTTTVRVAVLGRVPVIVSLENGPIHQGDRIAASSVMGVGMKATRPGSVVGVAMQSFDATGTASTISCDPTISATLENVGISTPPHTCLATILVSLKPGSDLSIGEVLQDAVTTQFATINDAMQELVNEAYTKGAEVTKFVVGELVAKVAVIGNLFADHITVNSLEVGSASQPAGITMYDTSTKMPYCILMTGGKLMTSQGTCAAPSGSPQVVEGSSSVGSSTSAGSSNSTSTPAVPPVIRVLGDNPANLHIGDVYSDLGVTTKDSAGHDLDVRTFLNGTLVQTISLDTSTTTTYTIDYAATDTNGLTATSTRQVIVQ
jgi:hypothetical protein